MCDFVKKVNIKLTADANHWLVQVAFVSDHGVGGDLEVLTEPLSRLEGCIVGEQFHAAHIVITQDCGFGQELDCACSLVAQGENRSATVQFTGL